MYISYIITFIVQVISTSWLFLRNEISNTEMCFFWRTIFTRTQRHTYIDPDYAHVDDDDLKKWRHRDSYVQLLRDMKEKRLNKKKAKYERSKFSY